MKTTRSRSPRFPSLPVLLAGVTLAVGPAFAQEPVAPDEGWPRVYIEGATTNTIYQPQLDAWDGRLYEAHAAVSVQPAAAPQPIFGVATVTAQTFVDKSTRLVYLENLQITKVDFPSAPDKAAEYTAQLSALIPKKVRTIALDRLEANLAIVQQKLKANAQPLQNNPPRILVSTTPALLILVDGAPFYLDVPGTTVQRVLNTSALLIKDNTGRFYLHLYDGYVTAATLDGAWAVASTVPPGVKTAEELAVKAKVVDLLEGELNPQTNQKPSLRDTALPAIYVATQPTELVVFEGAPSYVPIADTQLLYVANTTANVFKYLPDQQNYLMIGGRWFRAPKYDGPWSFVSGTELPRDFGQIPDTNPKENVKAAVPGTAQAQEAVIANSIPQESRVDRQTATMTSPEFDGGPKLAPLSGTPLSYVINSATPIIRVDENSWYACENGVWFVATGPSGPWAVATSVPAVIYSIPPSAPLHYVTYVRVYDATPQYVYVGYTPGYYGTVVSSGGVVVYGTGYSYTPWIGNAWYAPPVTYGYGASVAWTPFAGWAVGFGFGFATGYWGGGYHYHGCYPPPPCWGPYRGYYRHPQHYSRPAVWGPGGYATASGNIYYKSGTVSGATRVKTSYNASTGNQLATQYGKAYNSRTGAITAGQQGVVKNVYTGNHFQGGRGAADNPATGTVVSRRHLSAGNQRTGQTVPAGRSTDVNPPTGKGGSVSVVRGAPGSVGKGNDNIYGTKDGQVYRQSSGNWQQVTKQGNWQPMQDANRAATLNKEAGARQQGDQRAQTYQKNTGSVVPPPPSRSERSTQGQVQGPTPAQGQGQTQGQGQGPSQGQGQTPVDRGGWGRPGRGR